jgi:hypothetical protein
VATNEDKGVATARIGNRNACIRCGAKAGRDSRNHLERHTLLVQEQRLTSPAVEYEWIAPLQSRDDLALAGFLGQQIADGLLFERLRGGDADVNFFRVRPRVSEKPRMNGVIVEDDIR